MQREATIFKSESFPLGLVSVPSMCLNTSGRYRTWNPRYTDLDNLQS